MPGNPFNMPSNEASDSPERPSPSKARSFTRMDAPSQGLSPRNRSKTAEGITTTKMTDSDSLPLPSSAEGLGDGADVFEKPLSTVSGDDNDNQDIESSVIQKEDLPERFDELPIELMSLTDRFVESLSEKVYNMPPSIDQLSDLFQAFYGRAASHVSTHISALASRLNREDSPSPSSGPSTPRPKRVFSSMSLPNSGKRESQTPNREQQMLTATEVAERRRARKLLRYKQQLLEDAVERRACESIYEKIWRHRSTLDEVRDEKLRSRTAALALVGIQMKDLGVEMPMSDDGQSPDASSLLLPARDSIMQMNMERYPLGKLQNLIAAHKAIVDTLTDIFPSSSSADEILPTLIYTLIISPQDVNIISNLLFIQRFRAANKIDGEAAYCMTNLEAAISFLENVDMATLGVDEPRQSTQTPVKTGLTTLDPVAEPDTDPLLKRPVSSSQEPQTDDQASQSNPSALSRSPQQRLSSLFQPPAKALGAANDIVRNTADQGIKNISNTLDNSFNFLFGRLKEVQMTQGGGPDGKVAIVPKTLDDARRLVNPTGFPGDDTALDESDSLKSGQTDATASSTGPKFVELVGGRRLNRDSVQSHSKADVDAKGHGDATPSSAFDSVKNFGNTLNPLNRIPGVMRGFGRNTPEQQPAQGQPKPSDETTSKPSSVGNRRSEDKLKESKDQASNVALPIKRFVEMQDPAELKLADIPELLEDYKRLASMLESREDV